MNFLNLMTSLVVGMSLLVSNVTPPPPPEPEPELIKVSATAYYDIYGYGYGADGSPLVEGLTIAGKVDWLGKSAAIYDLDYKLMGVYEFRDTGYGTPTGIGQSEILDGMSIGTIENGSAIDIYFTSYNACAEWGRQDVYIQIIEAEG